jgi:two-component system, NarL family, response regulator DegU
MNEIRILIVDGQSYFRIGLTRALASQPDFNVFECDPEQNPLEEIENKLIDIVLLGTEPSNPGDLTLCRMITRSYPGAKVVIMTAIPNDNELFEAMKNAAVAYTSKNSSITEIAKICRRAAHGEYPINEILEASPKLAGNVLKQFETTTIAIDGMAAPLSNREKQILKYISTGNSNKKIAKELEISEQTIKNHMSSIMRKLNANDRAHAVVLAIKHGLISIDEEQMVSAH